MSYRITSSAGNFRSRTTEGTSTFASKKFRDMTEEERKAAQIALYTSLAGKRAADFLGIEDRLPITHWHRIPDNALIVHRVYGTIYIRTREGGFGLLFHLQGSRLIGPGPELGATDRRSLASLTWLGQVSAVAPPPLDRNRHPRAGSVGSRRETVRLRTVLA